MSYDLDLKKLQNQQNELAVQVTKEIILKMIDTKAITAQVNEPYTTEICKAFKTVYQTVSEVTKL